MSPVPLPIPNGGDCWNRIGIAGDRTCPELDQHIHCRNCPVFANAAHGFFDRPAPVGYLADWAAQLAAPVQPSDSKDISLLIIRLDDEWLAVPTRVVVEVTIPRPVHKIPHRSNDVLVGMVNLRGQLQLQISMHGLLGVDATKAGDPGSRKPGTPRLVVTRGDGNTWVFAADEVCGVHKFARSRLASVPSTLANPANSFCQSVINWRDKTVGLLDPQRVFAALRGFGR